MRPFNLEEYIKDPSRKLVTREGRDVRIICTDMKGDCPIVALIKKYDGDSEVVAAYSKNGVTNECARLLYDLLFFADDIPDFKPYDKVLTRGHSGLPWKANLFSNFKNVGNNTIAVCLKGDYLLSDIIPFDENKVGKIEREE